METSYLSSQLNRTGQILRKGAEGQIKEYNKKHRITPRPIVKEIREWPFDKQRNKE